MDFCIISAGPWALRENVALEVANQSARFMRFKHEPYDKDGYSIIKLQTAYVLYGDLTKIKWSNFSIYFQVFQVIHNLTLHPLRIPNFKHCGFSVTRRLNDCICQ